MFQSFVQGWGEWPGKRIKALRQNLSRKLRKLGARAYLLAALITTAILLLDTGLEGLLKNAETRLFDTLVSHRFQVAPADPDIIVLDIDEAALARMAPAFGRWPWPNSVLGDVVTALEQAGVRAIVFDILFSDWDTLRPQSDADFNAAIAQTNNTYFPILRLDPRNDALSKIPIGAIPGAEATSPNANPKDTIAIVLPKVPAAIDNGKLGTHQVVPDHDGVIRRYPVWTTHQGWQLPSLPHAVARDWGGSAPPGQDILLNWRGPPFTYQFVSFATVHEAIAKQDPKVLGQFAGRTVIIGSTAPSLFDVKGTPLARIHPGVEILATAIDNLKHGDMLQERPRWAMQGAAILLVWVMAIALYRQVRIDKFDLYFGALQVGLIGVAYLLLNFSHWYIDVSAPLTIGFAFFAVARVYHSYSHRLLANAVVPVHAQPLPAGCTLAIMTIRLPGSSKAEQRRLKSVVDRLVAHSVLGAGRVTQFVEDPGALKDLFADTMLIYWIEPPPANAWQSESENFEQELRRSFPSRNSGPGLLTYRTSQVLSVGSAPERAAQAYGIIVAALSGLSFES